MPDKLDWLNKHYVLQNFQKVEDVIKNQNYKLPFELQKTAAENPLSEDFLKVLTKEKKYKQASEFLAYNMHQRALAWWGYCVVLSLTKELLENPDKPRDIEDIGKPKPLEVPEWAKMPEDNEPPFHEKFEAELKELESMKKEAMEQSDYWLKQAGPEAEQIVLEAKKMVWEAFKKEAGLDPDEFLEKTIKDAIEFSKTHVDFDETKTPIYKATQELKEKIEAMRQDTIKTIKMAVPQKSLEEIKVQKSSALDAAYRFIIAPGDENANICLNIGNTCPDMPEGLLDLVCFWSYGNLTPTSGNVVKTPEGLSSNGMNSLLLMCSLAEGGTRKFEERVEHYFNIGQEIAFGINNFAAFSSRLGMPHKELYLDDAFDGYIGDNVIRHQSDSTLNENVNNNKEIPAEYSRFKG